MGLAARPVRVSGAGGDLKQGNRFFNEVERTTRLEEAYHAVMKLPPSPYGRLLREGVNFFSELRPGVLRETDATTPPLTVTQLEALRMVLAKEVGAERAAMARMIPRLATIGPPPPPPPR